MIKDVKAVVLRAAGINCDLETEFALTLAGAKAERIHINRLIENKNLLFFVGSELGSCSLVTVEIVSPRFSYRISITFQGEAQ